MKHYVAIKKESPVAYYNLDKLLGTFISEEVRYKRTSITQSHLDLN